MLLTAIWVGAPFLERPNPAQKSAVRFVAGGALHICKQCGYWFEVSEARQFRFLFDRRNGKFHHRTRAILPRIRSHDFRDAHATHLLKSGVRSKLASEPLKHSKVGSLSDLPSHVLPGMQADVAALVDDALKAALNKRGPKG
jgi:integrase